MTKYKAIYNFEASSPEEAAQKVYASFYLAEIEAEDFKLEQVNVHGVNFQYPFTQTVIRRLSEKTQPEAEGDWLIDAKQDRTGEDTN